MAADAPQEKDESPARYQLRNFRVWHMVETVEHGAKWVPFIDDIRTIVSNPPPIPVPPVEPVTGEPEWRLVQVPYGTKGGHGSWVETNHPAVVECMGSAPACAENGCQLLNRATATANPPPIPDSQREQPKNEIDRILGHDPALHATASQALADIRTLLSWDSMHGPEDDDRGVFFEISRVSDALYALARKAADCERLQQERDSYQQSYVSALDVIQAREAELTASHRRSQLTEESKSWEALAAKRWDDLDTLSAALTTLRDEMQKEDWVLFGDLARIKVQRWADTLTHLLTGETRTLSEPDPRWRLKYGQSVIARVPSGRKGYGDVLLDATVRQPMLVVPAGFVEVQLANGEVRAIHVSRIKAKA